MEDTRADATASARVFIALWPDARVRDALAAWGEQWQWNATAKRVPAERLHLTLHFLGKVPRERLPELRSGLMLPFAPFTVSLGRPAVWRGGVAVLQLHRVPPRLRQLHAALGEALQRLGMPTDAGAFRPHVTLARRAASALPPAEAPPQRWPVRGYVLVESRPQPAGGYVPIQFYP